MALKKGIKALFEEAMGKITTLTLDEARARHGDSKVMFVDIRDVRELQHEGVIPGAFHAPRGMLEFWVDPDSPYFKTVFGEGKQLVLFCKSGWRSALATAQLAEMGVPGVSHIEGGYTAWKEAGAPTAVYERKKK